MTKIDEIADVNKKKVFSLKFPNPRRERSDSKGLFGKKNVFFLRVPNPRRERSDSRGLFVIARSLFRRFRMAFHGFKSKISHFAADPEYVRAKCLSVMESNPSGRSIGYSPERLLHNFEYIPLTKFEEYCIQPHRSHICVCHREVSRLRST